MSESLRWYTTVVFGLEQTLARVPSSAWDYPSPCAGWTVREVAGHAMAVDGERSVSDDAGELARLIAFIGRDPEWSAN